MPKKIKLTIKFLEDNIGKYLHDLGYGNDFLSTTPKIKCMKKNDKMDFIKIKNFCSSKHNVKRMRKEAIGKNKLFQKTHLIKNNYPKSTKNSYKSTIRKQTIRF